MNNPAQKCFEIMEMERRNQRQSKMDVPGMGNRKPHISPSLRGYPSTMWKCSGLGDVACESTPAEAYCKWFKRVRDKIDPEYAVVIREAMGIQL